MFPIRSPRALIAIGGLAAAIILAPALADDGKSARKQRVDLAGQLVCIGCTLEKEHAAEAQCTLHAKHAQGFLAEDGTLHALLDNGRGHILITDRKLAAIAIRLEAHTFPRTQILEVIRFRRKEGDAFTQYDYCKSCGFEAGDNQGRDTCEDCAK